METGHTKLQTLDAVPTGSKCIIVKINGHGGLRHRLMEMGFVKGEMVSVLKNAPLLDPIEYQIMTGHVSLRRIIFPERGPQAVAIATVISQFFQASDFRLQRNTKTR